MQLFADGLHLRLQELACFAVAEAGKFCFQFLAAPRHRLSQDALKVGDVLAQGFLLKEGHTLLSDQMMRLLENTLVHELLGLGHWSLHFLIVAFNRLFDGAIALVLADVRPRVLDVGH